MPDITNETKIVNAKRDLSDMLVRLESELDSLINMFAWARKALENEMLDGMGHKQLGLTEPFVKKLKELTVGMNSVVETKIKYDKAKKQMASTMTAKEERDAVIKYIVALPSDERELMRQLLHDRGIWKFRGD